MSLSFPHGLTLFSLFTSSRERERYKDTSSREREKEREREAKVIFRLPWLLILEGGGAYIYEVLKKT